MIDTAPLHHDVCAVIVTYQPDPAGLLRLLDALLPQVAATVVVDNGSSVEVAALLADRPVTVLPLRENLGVAAGFNRGIAWAEERGCGQVLLLDQDSIPAPDMVARLQGALQRLTARGESVAAVGPMALDPHSGRKTGFARLGLFRFRYVVDADRGEEVAADFLISSGSLIPFASLKAIGRMDEGLFIDLVDTEWFLRGRAAGWRAYGIGTAHLLHGIGERTAPVRVAGREIGTLHEHVPLRHYYIFRNSVVLSRRPYVPWHWVLNNTVQLLGMLVYFGMVTPPRLQHLRMMLRGVWDGVRGRGGSFE